MDDRAARHAARNAERARRLQLAEQEAASRNQATRNQEIEIEFDGDDDTSSVDTSSMDLSLEEENKDKEESDEYSSSSSSESSWSSDDASSSNSTMGTYKVPELPCDGEINFERWYRKFLTHASSRKYRIMVSAKGHTDLPPEGELTEYSNMNKAQKKALKLHSKALNDLHMAFEDNPAGEAIIEKSKIDKDRSMEHNATITLQWPRGQVHRIFEELFKLYRKTTPADRLHLEEDLRSITMKQDENPKGVFQELFRVVQKYQYKTIKPTPDDLYATILRTLLQYLVMHLSKDLSTLRQEDAPPFAIIEKMETIAEDLYNNMVIKGITKSSSHRDMTLFGAEITDVGSTDKQDKWSRNAICYWCQEKGHKAYQCPQREAGNPKVPRKTNGNNSNNNGNNNGNNNSNSNRNNNNSGDGNEGQRGSPKCSICGEKHKDVMCWEDDRNAHQRPPNWKPKKKMDSLYGCNVVNYVTIKKYMIMYCEILVWYMMNVNYPPGLDYTSEALCFNTKGDNCSPSALKQYVKSMRNFLDCLMAQSSLRVSMSHSYNQVDLDKHFKKQRKAKRIFTTINLGNLDINILTHEDFYQYFLPELIQNSFVLGTTVLSGEKWVPVGFHRQGDTNILETGKVLLPLHSPLVFHYVLNYKDTISNYYNIHFEINDNRVTLSPCKLGTEKIDLAHFKVTKGILYLVKQWLIAKFVNHGANLGVNVVLSLERACNLFICQVLCASMIQVDGFDSSFDCSIDNVCKRIIQKVFKSPNKGCFGYDHVMETIEGLVLTERSFLKGAMVPESREENVPYFQQNDRLYIFPTACVLSKTQFAHVNFEDRPEELVTGILELSGLEDQHKNQTCVTRFLQYDVNSQQEVCQRVFMEHIPYVFREIFVIDPEVVQRHTWVEEFIHYSFLPEMGTIFTPLTEKLAIYLLEKSDDLSSANLVVQFLDDNVVNNYGKGTGELNPAFKHLQGRDFVLYKPSDFLTWDCFKTSKVQINEFNKSNNTYRVLGWVTLTFNTTNDSKLDGGNVAKRNNLNEGRNNNSGSTVTGESSKNKSNQSKESGIDTTKSNSKDTGLTDKTSKTCEKEGSNVREEKVIDLAKSPLNAVVTLPKFPLKHNGRQTTQPFDISVLLKDQDPEIMYPLYEVDKQVCYTERRNGPVLIGEVFRYLFSPYKQYENCLGYLLIFQKGKAGQHSKWCPYLKVSGLKETNCRRIKKVSDLVKCYSKEVGICEPMDGNVEVSESSSDTTKPVSEYTSSSNNSLAMDE
eukprot:jgi/Psemu1/7113/gm1.7113_g